MYFDFDQTLCYWKSCDRNDCGVKRSDCAKQRKNYYDTEFPAGHPWFLTSPIMQKFLDMYTADRTLCLLSACDEYAQWMKLDWVERNYRHKFENRCVEKTTSKLPMLMSIANEFNCNPQNILMVDDNWMDVLCHVYDAEFQVATPMDIAHFLLSHDDMCL